MTEPLLPWLETSVFMRHCRFEKYDPVCIVVKIVNQSQGRRSDTSTSLMYFTNLNEFHRTKLVERRLPGLR